MEFSLVRGSEGEMIHAKVCKRLNDNEGNPIGTSHSNPLVDSQMYEIEYADGYADDFTENVIDEIMITQVNEEGRRRMMLSEIIDHRVIPTLFRNLRGHMLMLMV
jgi:hypothetical protein